MATQGECFIGTKLGQQFIVRKTSYHATEAAYALGALSRQVDERKGNDTILPGRVHVLEYIGPVDMICILPQRLTQITAAYSTNVTEKRRLGCHHYIGLY